MTQFEKTFNVLKKPWVILAYLVLIVLAYYYIDRSLAEYVHQFDLSHKMHWLKLFTALGLSAGYLFLFLCAALYFRYIRPNAVYAARAWYLFACVFVPNLLCFVLKVSLSRARPELFFDGQYYGFYWFHLKASYWSFPSGHTTTVIGLASGLGVIFPRYFYAFLGAALLVAASRILLCEHYLSDVMSGFYLSLLVVGFLTEYLGKNHYMGKVV